MIRPPRCRVPHICLKLADVGFLTLAAGFLLAAAPLALAQSSWHLDYGLHPRWDARTRTYSDDKITVRIPADWTVSAYPSQAHSGELQVRGIKLVRGRYVLDLCTGCAQVSGIVGGRFGEISGMVQPWSRSDFGANPSPCGEPVTTHISAQLDRIDLWFRRDPNHVYSDDADDCRAPRTTATVWYGSYFAERCPAGMTGQDCGGYFLHSAWLALQHADDPADEMAFALTGDADGPDKMPLRSDPDLARILREASAIVASVRFAPPPTR